jgi:hypothetical protein
MASRLALFVEREKGRLADALPLASAFARQRLQPIGVVVEEDAGALGR